MNRRWFLGAIGSLVGAAAVPTLVKAGMTKVEIVKPQIITNDGVNILLNQIGTGPPPVGATGFGHGCIWQEIYGNIWVNLGTKESSQWHLIKGKQDGFLKLAHRTQMEQLRRG